jgi:hypothetical protein
MSENPQTPNPAPSSTDEPGPATPVKDSAGRPAKAPGDIDPNAAGADQVQAAVDAETAAGYHGVVPDPTPNSHYTVAGVTAGKPTPETDAAQAAKADAQARSVDTYLSTPGSDAPPAPKGK